MSSDQKLQEYLSIHARPEKVRTAIRREVADTISPLLLSHGFIKKNTTFFRLHGDYFLQVFSVVHPAYSQPAINAAVSPLYDFSATWNDLSCIRSNMGYDGQTIEAMAGLKIDLVYNSYLAYQKTFDHAAGKELELLQNDSLLRFDQIKTPLDYLHFLYGDTEPKGISSIAPLLRMQRYEDAEKVMKFAIENDAPVMWSILRRNMKNAVPGLETKASSKKWIEDSNQKMIKWIQEKDASSIRACFNTCIQIAYEELHQYVPRFLKQFPMKLLNN